MSTDTEDRNSLIASSVRFNGEVFEPSMSLRIVRPKGTHSPTYDTNKLQQEWWCRCTGAREWRDVEVIYL